MADLEQGAASKLEKSTTDPTPQKQWKRFKEYAFIKDATFVKKKLIRHLPAWNTIFALVCAVAVSLDTLFIYVPIIDQDNKCLTMDKKLRTIAVVLRLFTDLIYIGDIIFNVVKSSQDLKIQWPWEKGKLYTNALAIWNKSCLQILVDFLAILPIPQIIMLGSFKKITGSGHLDRRKILNVVLVSQYVPRVFRIYLSSKKASRIIEDVLTATVWIRGAFNFFLYSLASHLFGAFWYFFSVQRETECWFQACKRSGIANCALNSFCDDQNAPTNYITLIHSKCPINVDPDDTIEEPFDFGIFLDALKSGMLGSYDFPQKVAHCFWWGLRNLSSLGQNLKTSTYFWETLFAISISIAGLLLFLYLIGNLQTYLQLATTRSEKVRRKMKDKEPEIDAWMSKYRIDKNMRTNIMKKVKDNLKANKVTDDEALLSALPHEYRRKIKRKKVGIFKIENEEALKELLNDIICEHMKPVKYRESSYIIREGEPLDQLVRITQGIVWVYTGSSSRGGISNSGTSSSSTKCLKKGDTYGMELLEWSLTHKSLSDLPISNGTLKSHTEVEGFALKASDFMNAIPPHWRPKRIKESFAARRPVLQRRASRAKKVPLHPAD